MAAARAMLPLSNDELLEALVALLNDESENIRGAAVSTVDALNAESFLELAADENASPDVLGFLCVWTRAPKQVVEAAVFNKSTPDAALVRLAADSKDWSIIEAVSIKQQSLIRTPQIIDAILCNPARTPEAERRAREVKQEFFDKEFGAQMVAGEQRVRAEAEAVARAAEEAAKSTISVGGIEDLIRLGLIEEGVDDALVTEYESEFGPFDTLVEAEHQLNIEQIVTEIENEVGEIPEDRLPVFQRIALMSIKDRVMLAIKGTREARLILVRDPNRIVASAVMRNPRLTDTEIESIASIRQLADEVLRIIAQNRAWTRSYAVIHNLVRNPRTPIAMSLGFLSRIQTRDLKALSTNKNIPDVIRTTASRLYIKRSTA
jgi:hypothetical protein